MVKKSPTKRHHRDGTDDDKDFKVGIMNELLQQLVYSIDGKIQRCIDVIANESSGFFGGDATQAFLKTHLRSEYKNKVASIQFIYDSMPSTISKSRRKAIVSSRPLVDESKTDEPIRKIAVSEEDIMTHYYLNNKVAPPVLKMLELTFEKLQIMNTLISQSASKSSAQCQLSGQAGVNVLNLLLVLKKHELLSDIYVDRLQALVNELNELYKSS